MAELLETLLQASEKAARIARAWRCQNELFHLLVEEKVGQAKNDRFVRDFKTLADVLVQEVVKCDVRKQVNGVFCFLRSQISSRQFQKTTSITVHGDIVIHFNINIGPTLWKIIHPLHKMLLTGAKNLPKSFRL